MSGKNSAIFNFFENQSVFITGGSGFLGKILIEKLLRECHGLKKIYVLLREKKGKAPEQRFNELFNFPCFDRLKSKNKNAFSKVFLVNGDCKKPLLGINDHDLTILKKETTCVIHAAASVKLNQSLKEATHYVRATKDLLELATKMSHLEVFVYVSTAWSNCFTTHIKEEFYKPPMEADALLNLVDLLDDDVLQTITPTLLGKYPNTYAYTKGVSENLIKRFSEKLPLVLVRPGCICNTKEEPMPGWVDNYYVAVGILAGASLGLIRSLQGIPKSAAYIVPVDYVSNFILAAAWQRKKSTTTDIYNYIGHQKNLITWDDVVKSNECMCKKFPLKNAVWYYCFSLRESKFWHNVWIFFTHTLVAYIIDLTSICLRKPTHAVQNYQKLNKLIDSLAPFTMKHWRYNDENVRKLWNSMNEEDKKIFWFDMENFDWASYGRSSFLGGRLYLFNEPAYVAPDVKGKYRMLFIAHYTVVIMFYFILYKLVNFFVKLFWQ